MDKIAKALAKLSPIERQKFRALLLLIQKGDFSQLDLKKLKGYSNIYRVRKGDFRVIFSVNQKQVKILGLERRSETTYNL